MTKTYCYNGDCESIDRKNEEDHPKKASIMSFMNVAVVVAVSIITFVGAFIGGLLAKIFTL